MPKRLRQAEKQFHIYALIDPRDNMPRYVGMSDDVEFRFYQHSLRIGIGKQERSWIKELEQSGLSPILEILETIEATDNSHATACERERYWINEKLHAGCSLLNSFGITKAYPNSLPRSTSAGLQKNSMKPTSKVRELRIKAALNISELYRLSGVSRPTIEKMERDEAVRPDLASAVCRVLSERLGYEVTIESAEIKVL